METAVQKSNWKKIFFTIWTGQAFSLLGSGLVQFALVWWLTQTTHSATVLASATMAAILPQIVLGPFAGALVDRWNRRLVMIAADGAIALGTVFLALLFWSGVIQPWHVFAILFLRSLGSVFHFNAMTASTSLMVPDDQLTRVGGLNQTLSGILNIAAPPLGALLLGLIPMYWVLAVDVVTAAIAITPLLFIRIPQPVRHDTAETVTPRLLLKDVREGLRYVRSWPALLIIIGMAMLINFLYNPAAMLMPLLVTNHFHGDVWHLGVIDSTFGIGVVIGGLLLSVWGGFKSKLATSMTGLIGMGGGALLVGFAPAEVFWMAVVGYTLSGAMNPIVNGPLFAVLQSRVPPDKQARVFSLVNSSAMAMMPLGTLAAAPVANWLGIPAWFIAAGVATAAMGVLGFFIPTLVNFERDFKPVAAAEADASIPAPGAAVNDLL